MSVLSVVMFAAGGLLIYAGIKDVDPRDVIRNSMGGTPPPAPPANPSVKPTEPPNNGSAAV